MRTVACTQLTVVSNVLDRSLFHPENHFSMDGQISMFTGFKFENFNI
jgi:hypothetical protein